MANIQFQVRRGTASEWSSANPVLAEGEIGYVTDQNRLKVGDGVTSWSSLDYLDSNVLGGYPILLSSLADGDVLVYHQASASWINRDDKELVDGGNY